MRLDRNYHPLRRDRFERLEGLRTGDGRELPSMLKAEIRRELERIAVVTTQLAAVERARDALICTDAEEPDNPAGMLLKLKGLGPYGKLYRGRSLLECADSNSGPTRGSC